MDRSRWWPRTLIGLGLLLGAALAPAAPPLTVLIDTSGSMADHDPRRHALHLPKVLARALPALATELVVVTADGTACTADAAAILRRDPAAPAAFDTALEAVGYADENRFAAPLAWLRATLTPAGQAALPGREVLLIADAAGQRRADRRAAVDFEIARRVTAAGGRHSDVDVRVSLLWNTRDDLDLFVTAPSGEVIYFGNAGSACGGRLDVDRNYRHTTREPVENVRWPRGRAPAGQYRVRVRNYAFKEPTRAPVPFTVEIETGGEVSTHRGIISPRGETGAASEIAVAEFRFDRTPPPPPADATAIDAALAASDRALHPAAAGCANPLGDLRALHAGGVRLTAITPGAATSPFADARVLAATRPLRSQADLVATVAAVAARHGRPGLAHDSGSGRVRLEVPPHIGRLWLLISADTDLAGLRPAADNPPAAAVRLESTPARTTHLDGTGASGVRLLELEHPAPGTWTFTTGHAGVAVGWLSEHIPALAVRMEPAAPLYRDRPGTVRFMVIDPARGAPPDAPGPLALSAELDGVPLALTADGPGRWSAELTPTATSAVITRLDYAAGRREQRLPLPVTAAAWRFEPTLPARHRRDRPLLLGGQLHPLPDAPAGAAPPAVLIARLDDGTRLELRDDGTGDGRYSAHWTPNSSGPRTLAFSGQGGAPMVPASGRIEVIDWAELAGPARLDFGPIASREQRGVALDLGPSRIHGPLELIIRLTGSDGRLPLALSTATASIPLLPDVPVRLPVGSDDLHRALAHWALTLTAPRCPPASANLGGLIIETGADGPDQRLVIALAAQPQPRPWFICLLPLLLGLLLLALLLAIAWGFISPARFPRNLGVVLSPEEDLDEGFFQLLRARRGTGAGFYRDARACIGADFRIGGRRQGAVACLIAGRPRPRLRVLPGQVLERRDLAGDWQPLDSGEQPLRLGETYRTASGNLYLEFRTL